MKAVTLILTLNSDFLWRTTEMQLNSLLGLLHMLAFLVFGGIEVNGLFVS